MHLYDWVEASGSMQACPTCRKITPKGSLFCCHCGFHFGKNGVCPACGFENLQGQRFCGQCDKQLLFDTTLPTENPERIAPTTSPQPSFTPSMTAPIPPLMPQLGPALPNATTVERSAPQPPEASAVAMNLAGQRAGTLPDQTQAPGQYAPDRFAVGSIEVVNMHQLDQAVADPATLARLKTDTMVDLEERVLAANGVVKLFPPNIIQVAFPRELSPRQSLQKWLDVVLRLLEEERRVESVSLRLKAGLEMAHAIPDNAIAASLERSVATPSQLVMSEGAYSYLNHQVYRAEPVGPLQVENRTLILYRMLGIRPARGSLGEVLLRENGAIPNAETSGSPHQALPPYTPPVFGVQKLDRPAAYTYQQAVAMLHQTLSTFITTNPAIHTETTRGRILSLSAGDGLGKSAIVQLVRGQVDPPTTQNQRAFWLGAQNTRMMRQSPIPLYFWITLIQNFFGIHADGMDPQEMRTIVSRVLSHLYDGHVPDAVMLFMLQLLALEPIPPWSGTLQPQHAEQCLTDFLTQLASKKPLVLVLEDLEDADPASVDLLLKLLQAGILEHPILFLLTMRQDYHLTGELAQCLQLVPYEDWCIRPLDQEEVALFLESGPLAGRMKDFPQSLLHQLARHTGGLPLYLEECLRLLYAEGVLTVDETQGAFSLVDPQLAATGVLLPPTLTETIQARFAKLSDEARYLLQLAAALGERMSMKSLQALSQMEEATFHERLQELWQHGWVVPDAANAVCFRHGLLWEASEASLSDPLRKQVRQLISEYFERASSEVLVMTPGLKAFYAEVGSFPRRAGHYWQMAGLQAAHLGSMTGANMALFHGLHLLTQIGSLSADDQLLRQQTLHHLALLNTQNNPDLAIRILSTQLPSPSQGKTHTQPHPTRYLETYALLADCYEAKGYFRSALETQENALRCLDANRSPLEAFALQSRKLHSLTQLGRLDAARQLVEKDLDPMAKAHDVRRNATYGPVFVGSRDAYANILLAQCKPAQAFQVMEEGLLLARHHDLPRQEITLKLTRARAFLLKGQYASAQRILDVLLEAIESAGADRDLWLGQWGMLVLQIQCELGDWKNASLVIPNCTRQAEEAKDYVTWLMANLTAGHITAHLGNAGESCRILEETLTRCADYQLVSCALEGWRYLAETELYLGMTDMAHSLCTEAMAIAERPEIQNRLALYRLMGVRARCLMQQGQMKPAGKLLEAYWPQIAQTQYPPLVAETARVIGLLYQKLAQQTNLPDLQRKHHRQAMAFFQKSKALWQEMGNAFQVAQVEASLQSRRDEDEPAVLPETGLSQPAEEAVASVSASE